ncbi:hypothetical protein PGB90_009390 [Kerria lacca]
MLLPLWILLLITRYNFGEDLPKPPPTIRTERNWIIPENTRIGDMITRVSAMEDEDNIIFGLEHVDGFNIAQSDPIPFPFYINETTGIVYTNQSLTNVVNRDILLYVTATFKDSNLAAKVQVWAKIEKAGEKKKNNLHSGYPKSIIPNFANNKFPPDLFNMNDRISYTKLGSLGNETKSKSVNTTTLVTPATTDTSEHSKSDSSLNTKTYNDRSSTVKNTKLSELTETKEIPDKLIIALLPSIIIGSSLLTAVIVAYLFRKKICKKRKKMKKDDMKKGSNSLTSLDESMVLRQWRGNRALSNTYDSWDATSAHNTSSAGLNSESSDKWEIPRHHIKVFNILGEGCFGQVWKCEALNIDNKEGATVVAVKMLKENAGEQERSDLLHELEVMKILDPHPNVVRLLACCTDRDPIFVIMEYVPNGKLQSFLRQSRAQCYYNNMHGSSNTLTSQDLTAFCYQIAKGMQYLSSKGIIHRDLAARNILVGENRTCKVADFGFARDIMTSHVYERKSEGRLPIRWMAPESLYDNIFSVKSDIWSYGVLVWEIVTLGSTPYPGISAAAVMRRVRDGHRLEKPEHCRRELYNIMYYCWDKDPEERPTFGELVDLLEQLLLTETDYIQLDKFPDHSYYNMVSLSGEKL